MGLMADGSPPGALNSSNIEKNLNSITGPKKKAERQELKKKAKIKSLRDTSQ